MPTRQNVTMLRLGISCCLLYLFRFFFKQKTAYEIKECDWSSDVCSSDLLQQRGVQGAGGKIGPRHARVPLVGRVKIQFGTPLDRLGESEPDRDDKHAVVIAGARVGLGELGCHCRLVSIGP